jgi:hypothetical protein
LVRRERERFTGWIAALGTDSRYRVVIGHWHRSLTAAYRFDDVQVATCHAWRAGPRWMVQARPPAALIRHRTPQHAGLAAMGHTRPAGPNAMVGGLLDLAICRLLPGVRTRGRTRDGRAGGTEPKICTPSSPPTPRSPAMIWAPSERSAHRSASALAPCCTGHPWSTSPRLSRLSALVAATVHES